MKTTISTLLAIALAVSIAPVSGTAQSLSKIIASTGLSPQDFKLLQAAESQVYETGTPTPGRTADWENKETGSKGTAELMAFKNNCAIIKHVYYPKGAPKAEGFEIQICKSADGVWRITP